MFVIRFKIKELIDKYMLSQRKVALECNIRPTTLKLYIDNEIQRVNKEDLESLYNFFYRLDDRLTINDIIEFKHKEKAEE
ncbi:MAG: XRE family transcriptional regulator [Bacillota bacterium]|nr:XRE family transcriptional regulator [Bacillota bacterium]